MKVLLDHCTPRPLRRLLREHEVTTAFEMGWADLDNGDLLRVAEPLFDLFITTDGGIRYQQNLRGRRLAILLIPQKLAVLNLHSDELLAVVNSMRPGDYRELNW